VPTGLQPSLWNFVYYNVAGGGESALYGVEGPLFYLSNGFNNFTLALPLALLLPLLALLTGGCSPVGLLMPPASIARCGGASGGW
jgi:hypothetical protein